MAESVPNGDVVNETPVKPAEHVFESAALSSTDSPVEESTMDVAKSNEGVYEQTSVSGSRSASPPFELEIGFYKVVNHWY